MAYTINLTNGSTLTVVEDGQVDLTTTSMALVGKNYSGYGLYLNENFIHLLENFAGDTSPSGPLTGQLWFDDITKELKVWNSTAWVSTSKPNITNDNSTALPHYVTFVSQSSGFPSVKVSASKGIVFTPSTGNFGLGVTEASSKLVVNANSSFNVQAQGPNTNVVIHSHSNNGSGQTLLMDSYGGSQSAGNYSTNNGSAIGLRRSNGTSVAPDAVKISDIIGLVGGQGYNGVGYTTNRASMAFVATENWSQGSNGTKIIFYTTEDGALNPAVAMSIFGDKSVDCQGNLSVGGDITSTGTIRANGDVVAYYTSDSRLKNNVRVIENALEKTTRLNGVTFNWNELAVDKDQSVTESGLLAQQVLEVLPEAVTERDNGYLAVRYEKVIPLLVEAIKDLKNEIDQLKKLK